MGWWKVCWDYFVCFVGCRGWWSSIVDFGFKYLTPLFFLLQLTCYRLFCPRKAAREFKEGRKEMKIPFKSKFISGFYDYSVGVEIISENSKYCLASQTRC